MVTVNLQSSTTMTVLDGIAGKTRVPTGYCTQKRFVQIFEDAIAQISELKKLERYAFDEARNNTFVMADQTENQLWKKIINTSTDYLRDFVRGIEVRL